MVDNRVQNNKIDQNRADEKVGKLTLEKELEAINKSAKEFQDNMQRIDVAKQAKDPNNIQRLLDTPADKLMVAQLAKLTASIASSNIDLSVQNMVARVAGEIGDDLSVILAGQNSGADVVMMSKPVTKTEKDEIRTVGRDREKETEKDGKDQSSSRKTLTAVKEYTATYAAAVVNSSNELRKKMGKLEDDMKENGISLKDIRAIQGRVNKSIANDLSRVVKDSFLRSILSKNKSIEGVMAQKNLSDALNLAAQNDSISSANEDGIKGYSRSLAKQARDEAKDFVLEEMEVKLMQKILSGDTKQLDNDIRTLVGIAIKVGVNMSQFVNQWKQKKIDLGLFYLDPKLAAQLGMGGGDPNEEKETSYEMDQDEEKEILINRLRALYMRRAIKGDMITRLDTGFKMRKLKNGLINLGLKIDDFERIEKEGVSVAREKLLDMLKETMAERSTLYDLAGPAFKLIEKRIKGVMSNLDRIGQGLTVTEFENVRDSANRKMYEMAIQELQATDALLKEKTSPALERKRGDLIKLILRLKEESKIEGVDISSRGTELLNIRSTGTKVIQESA
jgi:hypothetical protein